jgi:hypothetical protein
VSHHSIVVIRGRSAQSIHTLRHPPTASVVSIDECRDGTIPA